ncbi:MAG: 2-oxoacid:acceptor oxidoreductase subunit alpha [Methanomicrobiales archaeon]|nr:2-oxoacid:acceptor oxidoreductase subunit alpha [Methanomicrobiales archaeon]
MTEWSVLIGGRAGEGLNKAGMILCHLLQERGYHVYLYYDYPSLIRGGHNFSLIRAVERPVFAHRDRVDYLLALNQETVERHRWRLAEGGVIVFDASAVRAEGVGLPLQTILREVQAPDIARNTGIIAGFSCAAGIPWETMEQVLEREIPRGIETNLAVARKVYGAGCTLRQIPELPRGRRHPILTGNEATGIGLLAGGLSSFIAYPMTPTSNLLHFLAEHADRYRLKVVHPENEIAVMLMALGAAYGGERVAVGTSGGGFCLMTEGLSLAGMAEIPVVIVLGQRPGPSTGLPTYSCQTELSFAISAGQGEFPRLVVAPANPAQACRWSTTALNLAWRYQVPAFVLVDKNVAEGAADFDPGGVPAVAPRESVRWDGTGTYGRYAGTDDGISPWLSPPSPGQTVKVNSYTHDELGISTEDPLLTVRLQEKLQRKGAALAAEVGRLQPVLSTGPADARTVLLTWGSCTDPCIEVAGEHGLRVVQPVVLWPFPAEALRAALSGADRVVAVEQNTTAQLARLAAAEGIAVHGRILKYDGRPFSLEDLEARVREVVA